MHSRVFCPARRCAVLVGLVMAASAPLSLAQIQPHSRYKGELLPVVGCETEKLVVLQKDKKHDASYFDVEVRPADHFGPGHVTISNIVADFDPLRAASPQDRSKPDSVRFRYSADVTSDRPLVDCYGMLITTTDGSIGNSFVKIGRLEPGRAKHIVIELRSRTEAVDRLHVFASTLELQSNEVPGPYDAAASFAALQARTRGVPAIELCKSERTYNHELSRDGLRLVTTRDRDTHQSLIVYDLASMKLLCDVKIGEFDDSIWDLTWINNNEVAFITDRELRLLDVAKGTVVVLQKDIKRITGTVRNDPETLVLLRSEWGRGSWTFKFHVHTRKTGDVEELGDGWSYFDDQGEMRLRFVYEGDGRKVYYKPTPDARWRKLDPDVKQDGLRFNIHGNEVLDRTADIHSIGPDGDTLYLSTRLGTDLFQLAAFSMSQGRVTRVIAKHPKYDLNTVDGSFARLLFRKGSSELIGLTYAAQKPQVVWLDPQFAAVQKLIDQQFPEHVNLPVDWSEDASTFIYSTFSDRDPGTYYVFRPQSGVLVPLLVRSELLKNRTLARTEPLTFTTRDGAKVSGYVTWPTEPAASPAPLIVRIHGGPTVRDNWEFDVMNQYLATRGYVVLQVNYRGSSGFGAAYQAAGLRARLDTVVIDDVADGARYLLSTGKMDPRRVGVMGGSFGGWATYLSLIKYPDLYRAGVAMAAVSHWRSLLRDDKSRLRNAWGYSFWKSLLDRTDFAAEEKFIDPLLRADEIKQPVYIMHGEYDVIVHPTEAKLMLEALRKHNPQVQSRSFPNSGHGTSGLVDRVTELNEVGAFFAQHLATDVAAAAPVPVATATP